MWIVHKVDRLLFGWSGNGNSSSIYWDSADSNRYNNPWRGLVSKQNVDCSYVFEQEPQKDEFLSLFYSEHILRLIEPLSEKPERGITSNMRLKPMLLEVHESVKESIVDILGFCVTHHGYRIKYFLLGNNITGKVLTLLKAKHRHLVLGKEETTQLVSFCSHSFNQIFPSLCWDEGWILQQTSHFKESIWSNHRNFQAQWQSV